MVNRQTCAIANLDLIITSVDRVHWEVVQVGSEVIRSTRIKKAAALTK